jgi:hypothetical protein
MVPPCPARTWRPNPLLLPCLNNSPYCKVALDTSGHCTECDPYYRVTNTFTCELAPCTAGKYRKLASPQTPHCFSNPTNCKEARDYTNDMCSVADDGFYVKTDTIPPALCSSVDSKCSKCRNGDGLCTTCVGGFKVSVEYGKCVPICAPTSRINANNVGCYSCSTITNCIACKDYIKECTECAVGFKLSNHVGVNKVCLKVCNAGQYLTSNTSCDACTDNKCAVCEDFTGKCLECISQYYLDTAQNRCFVKCSP